MEISDKPPIRLNLGCGNKKIEGFIGVDLNTAADVVCDVKKLEFADNSVTEIMAIHLFEHLYRWESEETLAEWLRVLIPGGLLAIEVPCLEKVVMHMATNPDPRYGLWGAYGDPSYKDPFMVHKWLWSEAELKDELRKAGFVGVKMKQPIFHKPRRDMRLVCRKHD